MIVIVDASQVIVCLNTQNKQSKIVKRAAEAMCLSDIQLTQLTKIPRSMTKCGMAKEKKQTNQKTKSGTTEKMVNEVVW